jgi:hypothetical protein
MNSVRRRNFSAIESTVSDLPLLTVFGEKNDPRGFQSKWAERFPNLTQVVVKNGRHFPKCDDAQRVSSALTDWHQMQVSTA